MTAKLERLRKVQVLAQGKEATYDAWKAADSLLRVDVGAIPNLRSDVLGTDADLIGQLEGSDQDLIGLQGEFPIAQAHAKPHTIAFGAAFAMGAIASTSCSTGAIRYRNKFTPENVAALDSFGIECQQGSVDRSFTGCFFESFGLSVPEGDAKNVVMAGNILGSGSVGTTDTGVSEVSESSLNMRNNSACRISTGAFKNTVWDADSTISLAASQTQLNTTVTDLTSRLRSFDWVFANEIDPTTLRQINSGDKFAEACRVGQSQSLSISVDYEDDADFKTWQENQTALSMEFICRGAQIASASPDAHEAFILIFPKLQVANAEIVESNGRLLYNVEFTVLKDSTFDSVQLYVYNATSTYAGVAPSAL